MIQRRRATAALAAALVGLPAFAQAQQEIYIPLVSKGFQHQFWQAVKSGAEQAAKDLKVKVTFEGPETEAMVDKQIDMLAAALAKKPQAIGFAALDSQAAIPLLKKAQAAKIPVVAFDSGVDSDIPVTTTTTDNKAAAALAADKMAEMIGKSGEVALVVHDQTSRTGVDRRDGFVNRIKSAYPNIKIVSVQYGGGDQLKSTEITKSILQASAQPEGHLRRQRGLGHRRGQRREGDEAQRQGRDHRLRLRQAAEERDHGRQHGRRHHAEPGGHGLQDGGNGGEGDQGREAAQGGRYRLLLVRQDQHR